MKTLSFFSLSIFLFAACNSAPNTSETTADADNAAIAAAAIEAEASIEHVQITPISHATMVLQWDNTVIYVDPVGGAVAFEGQPAADFILVTDIHPDHLNLETLEAVTAKGTQLIVPQAVADKLSEGLKASAKIMKNGENLTMDGIDIGAMPMYNLREEAQKYHPHDGRGNGYLLEKDGQRVYISGDTEGIPEMRNLKDIDIAFVCMNLPYTMPVDDAADVVLAFKPKKVYPYHYRGTEGLSDVARFKELVNAGDANIEVVQLDWYPEMAK